MVACHRSWIACVPNMLRGRPTSRRADINTVHRRYHVVVVRVRMCVRACVGTSELGHISAAGIKQTGHTQTHTHRIDRDDD